MNEKKTRSSGILFEGTITAFYGAEVNVTTKCHKSQRDSRMLIYTFTISALDGVGWLTP